MTDIRTRARLSDVLRDAHYRIVGGSSDVRVDPGDVLAAAVLSMPGIIIIETLPGFGYMSGGSDV